MTTTYNEAAHKLFALLLRDRNNAPITLVDKNRLRLYVESIKCDDEIVVIRRDAVSGEYERIDVSRFNRAMEANYKDPVNCLKLMKNLKLIIQI